jgi:cytochrome c-type biogenesis protein CcmH/NrfG
MSLIFFGWFLIVSSIVIPALLVFSRSDQLPLDIGARLKPRKPNEAESGAARPVLFSRLGSSISMFGRGLRGSGGTLSVAAAVFLLVAGVGAAASYLGDRSDVTGPEDTDSGLLARLEDYARSMRTEEPAPTTATGKVLPDVNTMTERLAARLETAPGDVQGWQMLGWSYFNTGRYEQAALVYAKAVELDPSSAQLKRAYEEAKAKASEGGNIETVSSSQTKPGAESDGGPSVETTTKFQATPLHENDAALRSMVDRLTNRLESSPRDADGWARLMRSRVVLGEREVAATAFSKALDVFKDESEASAKIVAAALELGLIAD